MCAPFRDGNLGSSQLRTCASLRTKIRIWDIVAKISPEPWCLVVQHVGMFSIPAHGDADRVFETAVG